MVGFSAWGNTKRVASVNRRKVVLNFGPDTVLNVRFFLSAVLRNVCVNVVWVFRVCPFTRRRKFSSFFVVVIFWVASIFFRPDRICYNSKTIRQD